jgi:predicted DCC family thiol-disulfide oxidoreductase YuxK
MSIYSGKWLIEEAIKESEKKSVNKIPENTPIILFDGVCNLCESIVLFTIKRDQEGIFRYTSLQSEVGQILLRQFGLPTSDYHSFILVEGGRYYSKSTAVLRVVKKLKGLWPILYVFISVPKPIRDFIYDIVAKSRYRWFGKKDECLIPTPDIKSRFLE